MQRQTPMLSQILHFLDFPLTGRYLANWYGKSMREHYREQNGVYDGALFLDSGGFKLLYKTGLDLEEFGIHKETEAEDILNLQLGFEGDIVASLDYPLPPNLARPEAEARMEQSLTNAVRVAERLTTNTAEIRTVPYLYTCCHGQSGEDIANYVHRVFARIGDLFPSFGLAVGSLVPFRGKNDSEIMEMLNAVVQAIPEARRDTTPIHAFGVSGALTPLLAYIGVDTFDSSAYIQTSRSLVYSDAETQKKLRIMEMDEVDCNCYICEAYPLQEIQQAFMDKQSYRATSTGKFKSEYYAAIGLHNFQTEADILDEMRTAIAADDALEGLVRHLAKYQNFRGLRRATAWLSENDRTLAVRLARTLVQMPTPTKTKHTQQTLNQLELFPSDYKKAENKIQTVQGDRESQTVSLAYTPDDFRVPCDYKPPDGKEILLVIPCAGKKPYSLSRTHTMITNRLQTAFGEGQERIHKITLSGLYGPVPEEFETEDAVIRYDFQLSHKNTAQIERCADRLVDYLKKYRDNYKFTIGYATSRAYRAVFALTEERFPGFILLPNAPRQQRLAEFFRHTNVDALVEVIQEKIIGIDKIC
jgi:tRNA-guanine family transglycosylase